MKFLEIGFRRNRIRKVFCIFEDIPLVTILTLIAAAAFFVSGKFRSDVVALCALLVLLVFQILTPEEALSGFSNQVVIMMIGLFVVGGAIFQTGLAKMIS